MPQLADEGCYLASESSFYRVLREEKQLARRGKAKAPTRSRPPELVATAPNQLWSWDITYLGTTVKGLYFYLYLIMDLFSPNGTRLLNTQVESLIQAMASFSLQTGLTWEQAAHTRPDDVQSLLAAHWKPAA